MGSTYTLYISPTLHIVIKKKIMDITKLCEPAQVALVICSFVFTGLAVYFFFDFAKKSLDK
jgi:hypothetical protein